jgi:hypothetical protein
MSSKEKTRGEMLIIKPFSANISTIIDIRIGTAGRPEKDR